MVTRRRAPQRTVERNIHFYRVVTPQDDRGQRPPFPIAATLKYLDSLEWTDDGRYLADTDGRVTCCWVDGPNPFRRLRLAIIRRSGLPQVEQAGTLSPLRIPAASGLMEPIHVAFFPNAIVGTDFNFYGPRVSRLAMYLAQKAGGVCPPVVFEPLLRQDVSARLDQLEDVRLMQLRLQPSQAGILRQASQDLESAFDAAERAADADEVEIVLRRRPHPYEVSHRRGLLDLARGLARRPDLRDRVSRFVVKGFDQQTGHVEQLDLLSDHLIARKQIVREDGRTRALDADSAYAAIESAFRDLRAELEAAAGELA